MSVSVSDDNTGDIITDSDDAPNPSREVDFERLPWWKWPRQLRTEAANLGWGAILKGVHHSLLEAAVCNGGKIIVARDEKARRKKLCELIRFPNTAIYRPYLDEVLTRWQIADETEKLVRLTHPVATEIVSDHRLVSGRQSVKGTASAEARAAARAAHPRAGNQVKSKIEIH